MTAFSYLHGRLVIGLEGETFGSADLVFQDTWGFRVLDESAVDEYEKNGYGLKSGWIWHVTDGGWLEQEAFRPYMTEDLMPELKEFFVIADGDDCVSVASRTYPKLVPK